MGNREVIKIVGGSVQYDGAGVKLVRVIGRNDVKDFDPFLMLDAFDSTDPDDYIKGFPWHPHRGIETVTYLIEGSVRHGDSLGNTGTIHGGGCQWMTAGSGIIHQEMPQPEKRMIGAQLWLNLPKSKKMTVPAYHDIRADMIPVVKLPDGEVRIISGTFNETEGPSSGEFVKTRYLDVSLEPGAEWELDTDPEETVFCYLVEGRGRFDENSDPIPEHRAVLMSRENILRVKSLETPLRFLLFSGKPLGEPVAWGGPIVMNTREELNLAFRELDEGTFIK